MNRVHVEPTEFKDVRTGAIHKGFRAWDDEGQSYDNSWEEIPDDDEAFLRKAFASIDATFDAMLTFCRMNRAGVFVGVNYFPWEKVEKILEQSSEEEKPDAKSEKH